MDHLLTTIIFAYNSCNYIEECVESILSQETNLNYKILLCYTHSKDNTYEKIISLKNKYPQIEIVIFNKDNSFSKNTFNLIKNINSKYLTIIDGDDFVLNTKKLQMQVDFLEENTDFNGVFHDVKIKNEHDSTSSQYKFYSQFTSFSQFNSYNSIYYPWNAVNRIIIPPSSLVFRAEPLLKNLNELILINYSGMWMMSLLLLKNSKFKYINEQWSIYRNHNNGLTKTDNHSLFVLSNIKVLKKIVKDNYYSSIKWDIYKSMSQEYLFLYDSLKNIESNKSYYKPLLLSFYYSFLFYIQMLKRPVQKS